MAGKVLIYGGSGGIGSATARALQARGYALHLVGRDEAKLRVVIKSKAEKRDQNQPITDTSAKFESLRSGE